MGNKKKMNTVVKVLAILAVLQYCRAEYVPGDNLPWCQWPWAFTPTLRSYEGTIQLEKFLGTWFEQARIPMFFENSRCSFAKYRMDPDHNDVVLVHNGSEDPDYPNENIDGTATMTHYDGTRTKFKLVFNLFARGNYWILDIDNVYQWALIGEPCKKTLFVLTRERHVPRS